MSAASETGITIESCRDCGARWVLERERCPHCGSARLVRSEACGRGTVFAATLVHRAPDEAFRAIVPYRIGLVDLEEGPRVLAHLAGEAPIGTKVVGAVAEVAGHAVPVFRARDAAVTFQEGETP